MSKNALRKDKTCLNCHFVVEQQFCPHCGQENIDTRKTFYELFIHFFEDLTHYENAFWKTIKNLLLKPATLTKEYLSGRRLSYLAPFRLYIFISFITFFFISISYQKASYTIKKEVGYEDKTANKEVKDFLFFGYESTKKLDSIQKYGTPSERLSSWQYWIIRKGLTVNENNTPKEMLEKFKESFLHNIPKFLFIYMPIFAFFLWLFHNKKRWYYFDHGIFTLHYFSFLLLLLLILSLIDKLFLLFGESSVADFIKGLINLIGFGWMTYYFFPAYHRFYGEPRVISFIKTAFLFVINLIFVIIILFLFALYTFINLH